MITEENWIDFIHEFFEPTNGSKDWIKHVANNWNHMTNKPGCTCRISATFISAIKCDEYESIEESRMQFDKLKPIDDHSELY